MASYEIVRSGSADKRVDVVSDLPPMEQGMILFRDGHFWRVDRIEPADGTVEGRLVVSLTHDEAEA